MQLTALTFSIRTSPFRHRHHRHLSRGSYPEPPTHARNRANETATQAFIRSVITGVETQRDTLRTRKANQGFTLCPRLLLPVSRGDWQNGSPRFGYFLRGHLREH